MLIEFRFKFSVWVKFGKSDLNRYNVRPLQQREKNRWVGEWWYLYRKGHSHF